MRPMRGPHFQRDACEILYLCATQHSVDGQPVRSAPSISGVLCGRRSFTQNTHASFYNAEGNSSVLQRC